MITESEAVIIRFKEIIVRVLKSLQDPRAFGVQWVNKHVTRFLTDFRDELRYNEVAIETLIRAGLVNMQQFDIALSTVMENGPNYRALNLATVLIQNLILDERGSQLTEQDLGKTIDVMLTINAHARQPPENLTTIIDLLRQHHDQSAFFAERPTSGPIMHIHNGILQVSFY